jgi:hypothetical protein
MISRVLAGSGDWIRTGDTSGMNTTFLTLVFFLHIDAWMNTGLFCAQSVQRHFTVVPRYV